ncbi:MAG: ATP-binding protein [Polyangiaceae bacterium]
MGETKEERRGFAQPDPASSHSKFRSTGGGTRAPGDWLVGGGEMAKCIKAKDWSNTPLGPIESWPQSLRTVVSLAQASNSPISLAWGEGHVQIYNDGYWPICGDKHPTSMGQDFRECWASAFPVIGEAYETAWSGKSAYLEKMRMFLDRYGFLEETWFTFSFSPITDESGGIGGLFHPVTEMTDQMLSERRTRSLRDLSIRAGKAKTVAEAFALSVHALAESDLDLPFVLFYAIDEVASTATLVGATGLASGTSACPKQIDLRAKSADIWDLAEVARTAIAHAIDDIEERFGETAVGPYPERPKTAFAVPITQAGSPRPIAVMVAGVSPRLRLTDSYRAFFDMVGTAVSAALGNARAYEEERQKAEALAAIDRAKTAFFSNVSHEFRTPLTLMLAPLEDELAEKVAPLPPARRDRLEAAHRNSLRLLKLVNSLLDFARIEAGRTQAAFEPTDLAAHSAELASSFRSAVERAGVALVIDCPPLATKAYVDREMWEKILLNLLSNAFKHTFEGAIEVRVREEADRVVVRVKDSGVGIPATELPRLFERFHRVKEVKSRSYEGTGIGLALVRELVNLHGGDVHVESELGAGTTFTVTLPLGSAHLPAEKVRAAKEHAPHGASASTAAFVQEALQWLPHAAPSDDVARSLPPPSLRGAAELAVATSTDVKHRPRIVWADDNADMREYVRRLLAERYEVSAFSNGADALAAIREHRPDLVLTDVMMPLLDGFGLLQALRDDSRTRTLPVLLLSARAGEESALEGLEAGADDYLVKPFSARELLARVRTHLDLARLRREWATELERANSELAAFSYSVSHDLRAPLRAIDGFSRALLDEYNDKLDERGRHYLERVRVGSQRMGALIDDLLKLSRLGRSELRREPILLDVIAREIVAELQKRDPARHVAIDIEGGLDAYADSRLMTVMLENLLGNAWKFTSKREHAIITMGQEKALGETRFFIRDNGAGFDMSHATKLFEPFHRMHKVSEFEGTGIGLATVSRIVSRHGGRIWADAKSGEGATFFFTLGAMP